MQYGWPVTLNAPGILYLSRNRAIYDDLTSMESSTGILQDHQRDPPSFSIQRQRERSNSVVIEDRGDDNNSSITKTVATANVDFALSLYPLLELLAGAFFIGTIIGILPQAACAVFPPVDAIPRISSRRCDRGVQSARCLPRPDWRAVVVAAVQSTAAPLLSC